MSASGRSPSAWSSWASSSTTGMARPRQTSYQGAAIGKARAPCLTHGTTTLRASGRASSASAHSGTIRASSDRSVRKFLGPCTGASTESGTTPWWLILSCLIVSKRTLSGCAAAPQRLAARPKSHAKRTSHLRAWLACVPHRRPSQRTARLCYSRPKSRGMSAWPRSATWTSSQTA